MSHSKKPVAIAIGTALAGGLILSGSAFAVQPLAQGYLLSAQDTMAAEKDKQSMAGDKAKEGSCGMDVMDTDKDGKVSRAEFDTKHADKADQAKFDKMDANKDGFIDATESKAHKEGSCGGDKKAGEGKCGEGKCGGGM